MMQRTLFSLSIPIGGAKMIRCYTPLAIRGAWRPPVVALTAKNRWQMHLGHTWTRDATGRRMGDTVCFGQPATKAPGITVVVACMHRQSTPTNVPRWLQRDHEERLQRDTLRDTRGGDNMGRRRQHGRTEASGDERCAITGGALI